MKICNSCEQELPLSEFTKSNGAKYPRSKCKACERRLSKVRKKLREVTPLPNLSYQCPICLRDFKEVQGRGGKKTGAWCLDHDHKTEKFRGWLCHDCNKGLGFFADDPGKLKRGAEYLEGHLK